MIVRIADGQTHPRRRVLGGVVGHNQPRTVGRPLRVAGQRPMGEGAGRPNPRERDTQQRFEQSWPCAAVVAPVGAESNPPNVRIGVGRRDDPNALLTFGFA